ncbi:hypothetical protein CW304_24510 [Bacillus sp. UFRGS-B20]|nr:hypothetical protein CW304_24510 [Bacillus sp. UFRGS-B20]
MLLDPAKGKRKNINYWVFLVIFDGVFIMHCLRTIEFVVESEKNRNTLQTFIKLLICHKKKYMY